MSRVKTRDLSRQVRQRRDGGVEARDVVGLGQRQDQGWRGGVHRPYD